MTYSLIHSQLASIICDQLNLEPIPLFKLKQVCSFNGELSKLKITYTIYSDLLVKEKYRKTTVFMLIADLRQHNIILEKS